MTDQQIIDSEIMKKYDHHFKHLRLLRNINRLPGENYLEAETPDGRYISAIIRSNSDELEKKLIDWSPKT